MLLVTPTATNEAVATSSSGTGMLNVTDRLSPAVGSPSSWKAGSSQLKAESRNAGRVSAGSVTLHTLPTGRSTPAGSVQVWPAATSRVPVSASPTAGRQDHVI